MCRLHLRVREKTREIRESEVTVRSSKNSLEWNYHAASANSEGGGGVDASVHGNFSGVKGGGGRKKLGPARGCIVCVRMARRKALNLKPGGVAML
jgi:hypothetical protein